VLQDLTQPFHTQTDTTPIQVGGDYLEGAEVKDISYNASQDHTLFQILHFEHVLAQQRRKQLVAQVAAGLGQRLQDVVQGGLSPVY
jgi:hypothetical protein